MVWMRWTQETFPPREAGESARAQTNTSDSTIELPVRKIGGSEKPQSAKMKAGSKPPSPSVPGCLVVPYCFRTTGRGEGGDRE